MTSLDPRSFLGPIAMHHIKAREIRCLLKKAGESNDQRRREGIKGCVEIHHFGYWTTLYLEIGETKPAHDERVGDTAGKTHGRMKNPPGRPSQSAPLAPRVTAASIKWISTGFPPHTTHCNRKGGIRGESNRRPFSERLYSPPQTNI